MRVQEIKTWIRSKWLIQFAFLTHISFFGAVRVFAFTGADLIDLVRKRDLRTVEDTMRALPKDLLENFVLIRKSLSLQRSNDANPRMVLFAPDGQLFLGIGGNSELPGGKTIEIISAPTGFTKLEFRSIEFSESGPAKISEENPKKCQGCHSASGMFTWDTYNRWPNNYGSKDDSIEEGSEEFFAYKSFLANASRRARYKELKFKDNHSVGVPPFYVAGQVEERGLRNMPNTRLTLLIQRNLILLQVNRMFATKDARYIALHNVARGFCGEHYDTEARNKFIRLGTAMARKHNIVLDDKQLNIPLVEKAALGFHCSDLVFDIKSFNPRISKQAPGKVEFGCSQEYHDTHKMIIKDAISSLIALRFCESNHPAFLHFPPLDARTAILKEYESDGFLKGEEDFALRAFEHWRSRVVAGTNESRAICAELLKEL